MTLKQARLLAFIRDYIAQHSGAAPSQEEMRAALGFKSKASIHRLLAALEEQGAIERQTYSARAIIVLERDPVTVDGLRTTIDRLIEQEGLDATIAAMSTIVGELSARQGAA